MPTATRPMRSSLPAERACHGRRPEPAHERPGTGGARRGGPAAGARVSPGGRRGVRRRTWVGRALDHACPWRPRHKWTGHGPDRLPANIAAPVGVPPVAEPVTPEFVPGRSPELPRSPVATAPWYLRSAPAFEGRAFDMGAAMRF